MTGKRALLILATVAVLVAAGCESSIETGGNTTQGKGSVVVRAECSSDADCATAGCSGQICTTAEDAGNILTTCEYREEFSCLAKTSCGCVQGKCAWAETPEYETCIASFS